MLKSNHVNVIINFKNMPYARKRFIRHNQSDNFFLAGMLIIFLITHAHIHSVKPIKTGHAPISNPRNFTVIPIIFNNNNIQHNFLFVLKCKRNTKMHSLIGNNLKFLFKIFPS